MPIDRVSSGHPVQRGEIRSGNLSVLVSWIFSLVIMSLCFLWAINQLAMSRDPKGDQFPSRGAFLQGSLLHVWSEGSALACGPTAGSTALADHKGLHLGTWPPEWRKLFTPSLLAPSGPHPHSFLCDPDVSLKTFLADHFPSFSSVAQHSSLVSSLFTCSFH